MAAFGFKKQHQKIVVLAVVGAIIVLALFALAGKKDGYRSEPFTFRDDAGETIQVAFDLKGDRAILDGEGYRGLVLEHATSASGARYENTQEGVVLWNKGDDITLYKNDEAIFTGTDTRTAAPQVPAGQAPQPSRPAAAAPSTPTPAMLTGKSFRLSSHNGFVIPGEESYTLSFSAGDAFNDGFMHAKFCNNLNGAYEINGNVIDAGLVGTKMYCAQPEGVTEREGAFSSLVQGGAQLTLQGNALTLTDNVTTMVFIRQ